MKIPATPPDSGQIYNDLFAKMVKLERDEQNEIFSKLASIGPTDTKKRYLHWEELKFKEPPRGLSPEEYWAVTKLSRQRIATQTPFTDEQGWPFSFVQTGIISERLHEIDSEARGGVQFSGVAPTDQEAKRFLVKSLIEEPFNSSLLEGAATTRDDTKRLITQNIRPQTEGEKMVVNNYHAIEFIKTQRNELLTPAIIKELHKIITQGTLDNPAKAGVYRDPDDNINVVDEINDIILHAPPAAKLLDERVQRICEFANGALKSNNFIHPVIRAIIIHFMLAYDHPFVDGNGRTARALFYWSVLKDDYWLLEYVSISRIINEAPTKYGVAFLHTETDNNDLTYFLIHQLDIIIRSIKDLGEFVRSKQTELQELSNALDRQKLRDQLNHRQLSLLSDAIRSPQSTYTINEQLRIHGVSYLTARKDLEDLASLGFLQKTKRGNTSYYRPAQKLAERISTYAQTS